MTRVLLENAVLLDPEAQEPRPGSVLLKGERIEALLPPGEAPEVPERLDLGGRCVAPGFLDVHHHGGLVFAEASGFGETLRHDSASLARHGTTAFLPTSVAWPHGQLESRVGELASLLARPDWPGAVALGLHLEGPWINGEAAGAQPPKAIRGYDGAEGRAVLDRAEGMVRMVTLAPEVPGARELLAELGRRGVVAALGHTHCDAELTRQAVDQGLRHVTHLFNAMGVLHHREPGVLGVALDDDRLTCDLICDGAHVDPAMVRLAARAKRDRLLLITDRVELPARGSDSFGSGALRSDGTALRLPDGRLAGSCLTLDRALRNVQAFGALTQLEAVAACTLRPARLLGIEAERGTLRRGARADLAILDADGQVTETWVGARRVHHI